MRWLTSILFVSVVFALPPVIIDTDADIDDWWAISYLVKLNTIDIKAIIVAGDAWSDPVFGAPNIISLLDMLGCNSTIVAYGEPTAMLQPGNPGSSVPANLKLPIDDYWRTCLNLSYSTEQPTILSGAELIVDIISTSPTKVNYLILGSFTTLATAMVRDRTILNNIDTVYVSGGKYGTTQTTATWPYQTKTKGSSWNIFADPLAAQRVFNSGLKLELFTSDAQSELPYSASAAQAYLIFNNITLNPPELWPIISRFGLCTNQSDSALAYWDPSAAIYMVERIKNPGVIPSICLNSTTTLTSIILTDGGTFGWTKASPGGVPVVVCSQTNISLFFDQFYPALGMPSVCPASISIPVNEDMDGDVLALQNQINNLTARIQALEQSSQTKNSASQSPISWMLMCSLAMLSLFNYFLLKSFDFGC